MKSSIDRHENWKIQLPCAILVSLEKFIETKMFSLLDCASVFLV